MDQTASLLPTLTWTVGPGPSWEARGKTLDYHVRAGRIATLTVRDRDVLVHVRRGCGGSAANDLLSAARAFEIVAVLAGSHQRSEPISRNSWRVRSSSSVLVGA